MGVLRAGCRAAGVVAVGVRMDGIGVAEKAMQHFPGTTRAAQQHKGKNHGGNTAKHGGEGSATALAQRAVAFLKQDCQPRNEAGSNCRTIFPFLSTGRGDRVPAATTDSCGCSPCRRS